MRLLRNVHKLETGSDEVVHRHKKLFEGIGEAQRDSQDIEIHLPLKANAIPITQKPRRVPYHLMDPLKKRIKEFVENDIMEEVPTQYTRIHHMVFTPRSSTQTKEPERHQSKFGLTNFKPFDGTDTTSTSAYRGRFY